MSKNTKDTTVDIDYADQAVPKEGRKGFLTMFMIMLGFTFSRQVCGLGEQMAAGLDFWEFIKSLLLGRSDPWCVHRTSGICRCKDRT